MRNKAPWPALAGIGGYLLLQHLGKRRGATKVESFLPLQILGGIKQHAERMAQGEEMEPVDG